MVLIIDSHPHRYEAEALCRMFLRGRELKIFEGADIPAEDFIYTGVFGDEISVRIKMDGKDLSAKAETSEGKAAKMEYLLYEILSEIDGALIARDKDAVIIAKSRFENALLHLEQLSAFNIESIF